tara:strand:- start:95 stop:658 length:564 start_codon:yes stop_codon:yes gene_type:complete
MWAIIADWDAENRVIRGNYAMTETRAKELTNRLIGMDQSPERIAEMQTIIDDPNESDGMRGWAAKEQSPLPIDKQAPNAYYAIMPSVAAKYEGSLHNSSNWDADPVNKTVSFNTIRFDAELILDQMSGMREERDQLLAASDKYVNPDQWSSMDAEAQNKWSVYRQELRDLPATVDDPANPTWPTQPE